MRILRSLIFKVIFYILTVLAIIMLAGMILVVPNKRLVMQGIESYGRFVLLLARLLVGIRVENRGLEKLPKSEPYIICPKHESTLDAFMFVAVIPYVTALGKSEYFKIPIMGFLLRRLGFLSVIRNQGTAHMELPNMKQFLEEDPRPLLIYPEGTRVPLGEQYRLKSGAWYIQQQTGLDVYPVATNVAVFWPRKGWNKPGTVIFEVGDPIKPGLDKEAFMARLQETVVDRSFELRKGPSDHN